MTEATLPIVPDLLCFSHLRWDFVFQRPQHLLTRFAHERRVFFIEEPHFDAQTPRMDLREADAGVRVAVPHLPEGLDEQARIDALRGLVDGLLKAEDVNRYVSWYYTPMALPFSRHLTPLAVAYDCMDELSLFRGAPAALVDLERELLSRADVVFTGGQSLYEAKKDRHPNAHPFPSSVDVPHFQRAREAQPDPVDQANIPHPRLGFFGVLDERLDLDLLRGLAEARPQWQIVLIGPVVKIDPAMLPKAPNIHYLGMKKYAELPAYLAGWDVALLLFARNEATRYISPTKTPEYLAAGKPVVSTSIRDVVSPYGARGYVEIADTPADFVSAVEACLRPDSERQARADHFLAKMSWDETFSRMKRLLDQSAQHRQKARTAQGRTAEAQ
ncbi:MAG TPA: glycosyltransferase family 1 protein [Myxococcales bacterium]|jgi:UDP-galactopyranose mutase